MIWIQALSLYMFVFLLPCNFIGGSAIFLTETKQKELFTYAEKTKNFR